MSFLNNLKLSKEDELIEMEMENSEPIEEVSVSESVQDDVDNSSDAEEFQETMVAAEEDVVEMEKQEEVLEGLQEQDSIIEEKLEQPEEVTPEDVVVAQEAFAFALGRLCGSNEDYKNFKQSVRVSYESNNDEPAAVLRSLHTEGFKEFIAKVIESIKVLFIRIINWFKKLMVKIVILFDQSEKTLKKMEEVINSKPGESVNITEWQRVAKNKLSAGIFVASECGKGASLAGAIEIAANLKNLGGGSGIVKTIIGFGGTTDHVVVKRGLTGLLFSKPKVISVPNSNSGSAGYISFSGGTALRFDYEINPDTCIMSYKIHETKTNKDPLPSGIVELNGAKTYRDLTKAVVILKKAAATIKTFSKDVEANAAEVKKSFESLKSKDEGDTKAVQNGAKICKVLLSHAVLGAIKSYVSVVRGGVAVVAAAMKPIK